jgi:short subunit dehydrogenase
MNSFQGKVALISGGTSGIGRATSVAFAREGERVEVASRRVKENEETLKLVKEGWSDGISVKTDVSKEAEVKAKEGKHNRSLFVVMILVLITFIGTLIPFAQRESLGEKSIIPKESRLSELSPAIITEFEGELNKRLLDSRVKPFFYKASIQRDEINIFLDRHGWIYH